MTTFTPAQIAAMVAYELDPGHSDLDNEQPMTVHHGDGAYFRCLLGDIRRAKREAIQKAGG